MRVGDVAVRLSTGVPGLDQILRDGLIADRLYLLDGTPGAGKTTLALQFLRAGVAAGERCMYVTLAETREELAAGAASHGWTLDGIDVVELADEDLGFDEDRELTMYHASEVELIETTRKVLKAVEAADPRRVVFDSLSEVRLLAQSSLRYRRQIMALKQFFAGRQSTVLMLDDRTSEGPDMQLQSIAHGVISLEQRAPAYGRTLRQLQVVKFRGSSFSSGYHDFLIGTGGLTVFPRLVASDRAPAGPGSSVSSGNAELDQLMGGGVHRGTSTLLVGPPGSGKSTLALLFGVSAAQRGEHVSVFAFDESVETMTVRARGVGLALDEACASGKVTLRKVDPAEMAPGQFAAMVQQAVEHDAARIVVIDSLNGYMNSMPDQKFLTAQLHQLLAYLNNSGVVTFLVVAQSGMMGPNMSAPVDASYLADAVVVLRYFEYQGKVNKAISILKQRSGAHEETIRRLWFDRAGVHLSEPLSRLRGVLAGTPVESDRDVEPAPPGADA